jgi:predicted porin
VFGAGVIHEKRLGDFQAEAALRISNTRLDSATVADQIQASAGISRQYKPGTFGATYAFSNINAGTNFRQTDGNQHRMDLSWNKRIDALTLQGRYRYENNDREDLRRNSGFASYSPERNSISISAHWQFTPQLNAGATAEYIDSDYDGINILRDTDGSVTTATRHNSQQRLVLEASYRIDNNWRLLSEYQHSDVDDTFELYTFDKNRLMATVEFQF